MAEAIKGLNIKLGLDTTELEASIKSLNSDLKEQQKDLAAICAEGVLPMFSSERFILTGLKFRSLIHFELLFVYGIRVCPNFILFNVAVQFSQHHVLERVLFHCISLSFLS